MNLMFQPLRKYADFQGRARRSEFWLWFLFLVIVGFAVNLLLMPFGGNIRMDPLTYQMVWPTGLGMVILGLHWLFGLAIFIPNLAVSVRRLHDTNRSGWWLLIGLVPLIGGVVLLIFFVLAGTSGPNRFGPDPKGAEETVLS